MHSYRGVPVHGGQHERADPQFGPSPGVDLCSVRQEELDDVDVAPRGSQGQGGVVGDIAVFLERKILM